MSMFTTKAYAHDIEVQNADGKTIYYVWTNNNTELAVSYNGKTPRDTPGDYTDEYSGIVVIPASVTYNGNTYSVTSIDSFAFHVCTALTSVVIPNSVTSIGDKAFYDCEGLTSIEIPSSVTSIGGAAFTYCTGLNYIAIPSSVTSIGDDTFLGCSGLTSIVIPNSVTSLGNHAFGFCTGLTSITIPNSVNYFGDCAFLGCSGLNSIVVESGNSTFDSRNNCNAIIETSTNTLIAGCKNTIIPNSVTSIWTAAFYGCTGLTSIEIPNSVTSIGDDTFLGCSGLTSVTIPNSVTNIGGAAFYNCSGLTSVTIPNSVTSIGVYTFSGCTGLTSIEIPNSVTSIEYGAFWGCIGLTSMEIPNSVTSIGAYAFYDSTGLISVVSEIQKPFEIGETVFEYYDYDTRSNKFTSATLYVPQGTKEEYLATPAWNLFGENIVEMDKLSGIKSALNGETEKIENFDLDGHRLDALKKGLNIIRMSDGTIKKVVIK